MKFVSDLWQVGGFLRVLRFPPATARHEIHVTEILLKMALNTIKLLNQTKPNQTESWIYSRKSWNGCIYKLN
jgi:hypothetical protein